MSIMLGFSAIAGTRMQIPTSPISISKRNNLGAFLNSKPSQSQITANENFLAKQDLQLSNENFIKYIENLQIKANKESAEKAQSAAIKERVCKYV